MRNFAVAFLISSFLFCTAAGAKSDDSDFKVIEKRFADWTEAFNRRDLDGSCALFSKEIRADHQGVPTENWQTMRVRFEKLFADKSRDYKYRFKLLNVYRSGDLAVGRITWYLTAFKDGKASPEEETQSMDIFKPNKDGVWEMIDFVSFTEPDKQATRGEQKADATKLSRADTPLGHVGWFDITATDLVKAKDFYGKLFDWKYGPVKGTDLAVEIQKEGIPIGTLRVAEGKIGIFNGVVYVQVENIQSSCKKAKELGGTVCEGFPFDLPDGKGSIALVIDPSSHPIGMFSKTPIASPKQ